MATVGLIGCGEMGSALFTQLSQVIPTCYVSSPTCNFADHPWTQRPNIHCTRDTQVVLSNCDIVFLAVPSALAPEIGKQAGDYFLNRPHTLVSLCGGFSLADMMKCGYPEDRVIRIMPNTPTEVGKGSTAIVAVDSARSTTAYNLVHTWLSQATGLVTELPEEDLSRFTASYGCSPAYNYLIFEALSDQAVLLGLPRSHANRLVVNQAISRCRQMQTMPLAADPSVKRCYEEGLIAITKE